MQVRYNNFCVSQYFLLLLITIRSLLHDTSINELLLLRSLFFFLLFSIIAREFLQTDSITIISVDNFNFDHTRPTNIQNISEWIVHRSSTLQIVFAKLTVGEINVDEKSASCFAFREDFTLDFLEFLLLLLNE